MKKLLVFLVVLAGFTTSCSNEEVVVPETPVSENPDGSDDGEDTQGGDEEGNLVGTWDLTGTELIDSTAEFSTMGLTGTSDVTGNGKDFDFQVVIGDDGNFSSSGEFTQVVNYTLLTQEESEEITISSDDILSSGTWVRDGNQVTLNNDAGSDDLEIIEISDTILILQAPLDEERTVADVTVRVQGELELTFTKA